MIIPYAHYSAHVPDVGKQLRLNHAECPAGRDTKARLYVKNTGDALLAYCHNCGNHAVRRVHRGVRHKDLLDQLLNEHDEVVSKTKEVELPADTNHDPLCFSFEARSWLYVAGLTDADITRFKIGYSNSWGRVILPVYNGDGKLVFWQGRNTNCPAATKYVSCKGAEKPVFLAESSTTPNNYLVIVEDMLSAIRCCQKGAVSGLALLGTNGPDNLPQLLHRHSHIAVWLDNDTAGRRKASELYARVKLLSKRGTNIANIVADEPKNQSPEGLIDHLNKRPGYERI